MPNVEPGRTLAWRWDFDMELALVTIHMQLSKIQAFCSVFIDLDDATLKPGDIMLSSYEKSVSSFRSYCLMLFQQEPAQLKAALFNRYASRHPIFFKPYKPLMP